MKLGRFWRGNPKGIFKPRHYNKGEEYEKYASPLEE